MARMALIREMRKKHFFERSGVFGPYMRNEPFMTRNLDPNRLAVAFLPGPPPPAMRT